MDQSRSVVAEKFKVRMSMVINDDIQVNSSGIDDDNEPYQTITENHNYFSTDALPMMTYYEQTLSSGHVHRYRPRLQDLHDPKIQIDQYIRVCLSLKSIHIYYII